jgi:hypothetical protein
MRWAQWAYVGPNGENVIQDVTGEFCDLNQDDPQVWFLAGSFGKTGVVRNCTVPASKALFYPLIEGGWIDCPLPSKDSEVLEKDIRQFIAGMMDNASLLTSTLDGVPISSLAPQILTVRTQSPIFTIYLPDDNVVGDPSCGFIPPTTYPGGESGRQIIDGYWVMLPPLSPGNHILKLRGAAANWKINYKNNKPLPNRGTSPKWAFDNEVTYNLTVKEQR